MECANGKVELSPFPIVSVAVWITVFARFDRCPINYRINFAFVCVLALRHPYTSSKADSSAHVPLHAAFDLPLIRLTIYPGRSMSPRYITLIKGLLGLGLV